MTVVSVQSLDDPRLEPYRNLKATNDTRWQRQLIAEGDKLVRRLLESDLTVESLLVAESHRRRFENAAAERGTNVFVVPDEWIERIVGFNFHRGVLACARRKSAVGLQAFCSAASQDAWRLVACPDVQDPENLGSILRLASAFGVGAVVLGRGCCNPFSRRVLRVSMGAAFRVPIVESADLAAELVEAQAKFQLELWAAVTDRDADPFDRPARPRRLALLLGSEGHGLSCEWIDLCDRRVTIPMRAGVDSLNVSVAAGILLHHLTTR